MFLHSALSVFKKPFLLLQSTSALFPELADLFKSFQKVISKRDSSEVYRAKAAESSKGFDKDCVEVQKPSFKKFCEVTLDYIDKWHRPGNHLANVAWTMLKNRKGTYEEVKEMAKMNDPEEAMADELFDKF